MGRKVERTAFEDYTLRQGRSSGSYTKLLLGSSILWRHGHGGINMEVYLHMSRNQTRDLPQRNQLTTDRHAIVS
jgi:hypothetical protein